MVKTATRMTQKEFCGQEQSLKSIVKNELMVLRDLDKIVIKISRFWY